MHAALEGKIAIFLAVSRRNLTHIIAHEAANKNNILHQDISPGNLLILDPDESGTSSPLHRGNETYSQSAYFSLVDMV